MIKKFLLFVFFFFFIINNSYGITIGTLKLNYILNNVEVYNNLLKDIDSKKKIVQNKLRDRESELLNEEKKIEESKLLLSQEELNKKILLYQEKVNIFQNDIEKYNQFFSTNIDKNKSILMKLIIEIVSNISEQNNYDLILNEDNYFLSSGKIDISEQIIIDINKKNIELLTLNIDEIL